ncbi:zinc finger protein 85-like [Diaphorina citri]|jgi:Zinc-finger double-stranded RNA-binding.|uniref:Zinc finger protein 85-like n=1 Tax=Diaphorina citri TaxID=121845 RepID=A0A1S3DJ63_DIACI|nr:zinc finger protein 85-like [Diaphorina citri]KAI5693077.1 hypothetical protein M8J75_007444 [Diaphorina citri]KAI5708436.1 hypothetical protein M8J77_022590 [Diaphorina citri]KAI5708899.1 hypothetical protein M8J76_005755 [Diaphorina citri]
MEQHQNFIPPKVENMDFDSNGAENFEYYAKKMNMTIPNDEHGSTTKKNSGFDEEKKFKCTECERRLVSKMSLTYHMRRHTGIKYECDICNRQFNDRSNMKKHRNIHLNVRKYKCHLCPKTYSDPSTRYFKLHMEKHAGVRFKCEFNEGSVSPR